MKQVGNQVNEEILFANTEFPEDHVEDILDVHPPQQPPEGMRGAPKFLCRQFLTLPDDIYAAMQRNRCLLQQLALPDAADQPSLAGAEIILDESHQGRNQVRHPVPASIPYG